MTTGEAVVVGAGPNGLAAAVTLARAGVPVRVLERSDTIGGGARTKELTLPGFRHDVCSAVHPMAYLSAFFNQFGLAERIRFVDPEIAYAQGISADRVALAWRDLDRTAEGLGRDGAAWRSYFAPLVAQPEALSRLVSDSPLRVPRHPVALARLGLRVLEQGTRLWNARWHEAEAPALLTGVVTHPIQPMPRLAPTAAGIVLAVGAHLRGWPVPVGGSQSIIEALADDARAHGAEIVTGHEVTSLRELSGAGAVLLDTSVQGMQQIAGDALPTRYARRLRGFTFGHAAAKVDFALSEPVPWRDENLRRTGTLHLGGTREQMAASEAAVARGEHPDRPYVLASEPTALDPSRAPAGKHVLWAYTHVPRDSTVDRTEAVTRRIEEFAPGFRDVVLESSSRTAADLENYNPNYVGGDISAGDVDLRGLVARPVLSLDPWRTPMKGVYLCSSSTPPGPGVHGICGWRAALSALRHEYGIRDAPSLSP